MAAMRSAPTAPASSTETPAPPAGVARDGTPPPGTRMTREQSKAHTRERLLEAARSVFASSGFHGASVEEIAATAGFSTGALYSNFDGKEDLFLALLEREYVEHARVLAAPECWRPSGARAAN